MGFLDSVKSWLQAESAEAADLGRETKGRLERDLDRREADLNLTPEERLEQLQDQITGGDDTFSAIQDKIEGREALADATSEVSEQAKAAAAEADDILDLESEEITPPETE